MGCVSPCGPVKTIPFCSGPPRTSTENAICEDAFSVKQASDSVFPSVLFAHMVRLTSLPFCTHWGGASVCEINIALRPLKCFSYVVLRLASFHAGSCLRRPGKAESSSGGRFNKCEVWANTNTSENGGVPVLVRRRKGCCEITQRLFKAFGQKRVV